MKRIGIPLIVAMALSVGAFLMIYKFSVTGVGFVSNCLLDAQGAMPFSLRVLLPIHSFLVSQPMPGMLVFSSALLLWLALQLFLHLFAKRPVIAVGMSLLPLIVALLVVVSGCLSLGRLHSPMGRTPAEDAIIERCTLSNLVGAMVG